MNKVICLQKHYNFFSSQPFSSSDFPFKSCTISASSSTSFSHQVLCYKTKSPSCCFPVSCWLSFHSSGIILHWHKPCGEGGFTSVYFSSLCPDFSPWCCRKAPQLHVSYWELKQSDGAARGGSLTGMHCFRSVRIICDWSGEVGTSITSLSFL